MMDIVRDLDSMRTERMLELLAPIDEELWEVHETTQFLYFKSEFEARAAAAAVAGPSLHVETCESAMGDGEWLVLVTHDGQLTDAEEDASRVRMEEIAAQFGGRYDGSETAIHSNRLAGLRLPAARRFHTPLRRHG